MFIKPSRSILFIPNQFFCPRRIALRAFASLFMFVFLSMLNMTLYAQEKLIRDSSYEKVISERSAKIVNTLNISDSVIYIKVKDQIKQQYFQLSQIHDQYNLAVNNIKTSSSSKDSINGALLMEVDKKSICLKQLHDHFIVQITDLISAIDLDKIKDGMTYKILPLTWHAYTDMLQNLTQEQKEQMYKWLLEARELAMDEGSSEKKHEVFGKYKGKINNYLSAAGYNMKKEGEDWAKRIEASTKKTN